jgi:pimeloyl-ACP methyl ester carboxylesterase
MTDYQPNHPLETLGPFHPPKVDRQAIKPSIARRITIKVTDPLNHEAPAILHEPRSTPETNRPPSAVVLVSGAGGGVSGPAGIYPSLADKIALLLSIPCIRLDYREPARTPYCVADMQASFDYLRDTFGSTRFVIVGWSFGGSPCFTVAAREPTRVAGVATVASQTARTEGVFALSPRPLLLLHGEEDHVLAPSCSKTLFNQYGGAGDREMKLFPGDDHGLTRHAPQVERKLFGFVIKCLGLSEGLGYDVLWQAGQDLVGEREGRVKEMEMGRDLEGGERLF